MTSGPWRRPNSSVSTTPGRDPTSPRSCSRRAVSIEFWSTPDGTLAAYLFTAWQYLDLHILKVATRPAFRRQGLGRKLMVVAEEHARQADGETLTLEVRMTNTAAIGLYESLGYERAGMRPGYYADLSDALVMTKSIRRTN